MFAGFFTIRQDLPRAYLPKGSSSKNTRTVVMGADGGDGGCLQEGGTDLEILIIHTVELAVRRFSVLAHLP